MNDKHLRKALIRLAYQKPELRDDLLPLVTAAVQEFLFARPITWSSIRHLHLHPGTYIKVDAGTSNRKLEKAVQGLSSLAKPGHEPFARVYTGDLYIGIKSDKPYEGFGGQDIFQADWDAWLNTYDKQYEVAILRWLQGWAQKNGLEFVDMRKNRYGRRE